MRFWLSGVAALAVALWAGTAQAECQLRPLGELPARMMGNSPMLEAGINGHPAWLLADTGAQSSILYAEAAGALGIKTIGGTPVDVYGFGGKLHAGMTTLSELRLGRYAGHRIQVLVLEGGPGASPDDAGIMGRDLLMQAEVEMDLDKSFIKLFEARGCQNANLAYWTDKPLLAEAFLLPDDGSIHLMVTVNGRRISALLDSGAAVSFITPVAAQGLGVTVTDEEKGAGVAHGIGRGSVKVRVATFDTLEIGDETIRHARLRVADFYANDKEVELGSHIPTVVGEAPPVIVGADWIRAHHVMIAPRLGRLFFTYNGGPIFSTTAPTTGPTPASTPTPATATAKP